MKHLHVIFLSLIFFCAASAAAIDVEKTVPAQGAKHCSDLVKTCFLPGDDERVNCFYRAAKDAVCEGTELGRLTYQRWAISPNKPADMEEPAAFLGPQIVDTECLKNFDNQWSAQLINSSLKASGVKKLETELEECRRDVSFELTRP